MAVPVIQDDSSGSEKDGKSSYVFRPADILMGIVAIGLLGLASFFKLAIE